jgi:hypothetical protein
MVNVPTLGCRTLAAVLLGTSAVGVVSSDMASCFLFELDKQPPPFAQEQPATGDHWNIQPQLLDVPASPAQLNFPDVTTLSFLPQPPTQP